jgi:hypothetical protein
MKKMLDFGHSIQYPVSSSNSTLSNFGPLSGLKLDKVEINTGVIYRETQITSLA